MKDTWVSSSESTPAQSEQMAVGRWNHDWRWWWSRDEKTMGRDKVCKAKIKQREEMSRESRDGWRWGVNERRVNERVTNRERRGIQTEQKWRRKMTVDNKKDRTGNKESDNREDKQQAEKRDRKIENEDERRWRKKRRTWSRRTWRTRTRVTNRDNTHVIFVDTQKWACWWFCPKGMITKCRDIRCRNIKKESWFSLVAKPTKWQEQGHLVWVSFKHESCICCSVGN